MFNKLFTNKILYIFNQCNDEYKPCFQLRMSYRFNAAGSKYKGSGAGLDVKERIK